MTVSAEYEMAMMVLEILYARMYNAYGIEERGFSQFFSSLGSFFIRFVGKSGGMSWEEQMHFPVRRRAAQKSAIAGAIRKRLLYILDHLHAIGSAGIGGGVIVAHSSSAARVRGLVCVSAVKQLGETSGSSTARLFLVCSSPQIPNNRKSLRFRGTQILSVVGN